MPAKINLIGQTIGKLTVLEETSKRKINLLFGNVNVIVVILSNILPKNCGVMV